MQVNAASNARFRGVFQRKSDEKYNYYQMATISFTQHKPEAIESQLLVARRCQLYIFFVFVLAEATNGLFVINIGV
jgi:hypothetical protein